MIEQAPELVAYAAALYARRAEGVIVPGVKVRIGDWRPDLHHCHANVNTWVLHKPEYKAVRGRLFFDMMGMMPYVMFNPHSVVEKPDGAWRDLTPVLKGSQRYPFIRDLRPESEFHAMVEGHHLVHLYHFI